MNVYIHVHTYENEENNLYASYFFTELKKSVMEIELISLRSRARDRDIRLGRLEAYFNITRG